MKLLITFKKNGFTLIELLVVIPIIGLLASMSVLLFNSTKARARDTKRLHNIKQVQKAIEMYYQDHGEYPNRHLSASQGNNYNWGGLAADLATYFPAGMPKLEGFSWACYDSCINGASGGICNDLSGGYGLAERFETSAFSYLEKYENDRGWRNDYYEIGPDPSKAKSEGKYWWTD